MLAPQFRLNPTRRGELASVCELGPASLTRVAVRIESIFTIRKSQIEKIAQEEVGNTTGTTLTNTLFGIASTFRRFSLSAASALEKIEESLEGAINEDPRFAQWEKCKPVLKRLLETRAVFLAAKALDVSYDFERVYLAGRLLTSVRPVFDPQRENLVGSAVVQTLRLEFINAEGDQSNISVAMDLQDVKTLMDECKRAIDKAERAQSHIQKHCGFEAIIPGEEN